MTKKVEILAPAGSYESMKAAINAGADAVYIGGSRFGARAYADNLTEDKLLEAIDEVHLHGKKIYLTINTLLKEKELKNELYDYLLPYYKQGIDAAIVQDIGVLQFVREHFLDLPIHASTQMTITNLLGAKFLERLGVERVVTARELQLEEIADIAKHTNLEIESFVHGALCYCYSGQCLYSSLIGGRSGNRGQCAQPCRLPYRVGDERQNKYVLSLKDICTLEHIPELVETGIHSFKIEGRMKKPEYVALVTAMYRKYLDLYLEKGKAGYAVDPKDLEMLMDLYNRGGFHGGYYYTKNGKEMISLSRPNHAGVPALKVASVNGRNVTLRAMVDIRRGDVIELGDGPDNITFGNDVKQGDTTKVFVSKKQGIAKDQILRRVRNEKLLEEIRERFLTREKKQKVSGKLFLSAGEVSRLVLDHGEFSVVATGAPAQEAISHPMDKERIEKQMRKTGNTPFEFEQLEIKLDGNLFLPMQDLNELRRNGLQVLYREMVSVYRRKEVETLKFQGVTGEKPEKQPLYVYVEELEQLQEVLSFEAVSRIYLDCNALKRIWENRQALDWTNQTHKSGKEIYLAMPHIFRKDTIREFDSGYQFFLDAGWDGVLIRNYESYEFLMERGYDKPIITDYNLYVFNQYAKHFWSKEKVESTTASVELHASELQSIGLEQSELIVYGYLPMMVSAQCVRRTTSGCKKEAGRLVLKDRYQKKFVVKNHCDYCYNMIYNTAPLVLTDQKDEVLNLSPKALRMHFTIEERNEVRRMLSLYERVFIKGESYEAVDIEFTRGHFKRGIK